MPTGSSKIATGALPITARPAEGRPSSRARGLSFRSGVIRAALGFGGGFLASLTFTVAAALLLGRIGGLLPGDAAVFAGMLAFLVWPLAVLVAFAAATHARAAAWILGPASCMGLFGWAVLGAG